MAKNIMIQGTMSNVGKSLIAAGLCRIFRQDGFRVAPFKSQNMALNSFITADGGEMGRAQVVQAEAAGVLADVRMNPILLKPTTDVGSQVIVNGQVQGNMKAMEYFRRKREYVPAILEAYRSLAAEYDIIVIEGAGSAAEINLKQDDIVNMGLAGMVDAPVLLVGDIDRGGVFAQLYGTVALLDPAERARVKGTIVNKFRGDRAILEPGIRMLEELCGVPVAGVIPYTHADIDDEDSLTGRFAKTTERKLVDIAVIRLPRISNFTDFSPFERYENVSLRYVEAPVELGQPDIIFLPGTKSTIADMMWLRQCGLESAVKKATHAGSLLIGICGGFQMLGRKIADPEMVEAAGATGVPEITGMNYLEMDTVFCGEKVQTQTSGVFEEVGGVLAGLNGMRYKGYEIHMGRSGEHICECAGSCDDEVRAGRGVACGDEVRVEQGEAQLPALTGKGNVYGSYVHGLFDAPGVSDAVLKAVCAKRGIDFAALGTFDLRTYKEQQYDLLADVVRSGLDMEFVYRVLRREV